ncbi:hypothetical protein B296_00055964 [Ensete ventricosum]|uniref:Uncharacterized protein n=1 Tax=Ensete ventricosum TaxID=4639 RepID=A0A426WYJ8_ENSVE|nr:hypothetical protein B296_00055964 [Ensete ventricosum]
MPEPETPTASAPATPGTPGAPLFNSLRVDSLSYDRKSMPRCNNCLPVNAWSSPHTCFTEFPKPDVSLTRKVRTCELCDSTSLTFWFSHVFIHQHLFV